VPNDTPHPDGITKPECDTPTHRRLGRPLGGRCINEPIAELLELGDDRFATSHAGSDDPAGHVIAHHREIALRILAFHLVDGHGDDAVEEIDAAEGLIGDADARAVHGSPRHRMTVRGGGLVRGDRVIDGEVLERSGERGVMVRPGHLATVGPCSTQFTRRARGDARSRGQYPAWSTAGVAPVRPRSPV